MKVISVVIPCYNVESKIIKCIDSLKAQSYKNFKCYLIDDGSTDDTAISIKKAIKNDSRFEYVYKENGGQASARNRGIDLSSTKYITFIDSDDYIHPDYLLKLYTPFSYSNEVQLSACFFERIYENKKSINSFNETDLYLSKYPAVWGKMFLLDLINEKKIRFPLGLWYEDLCFFTEYMSYVMNISIVNDSLYYYMQNPNSVMYTYSDKIYDIFKIFDILKTKTINKERLGYIMIYHILIGTIFRVSFKPNFDKNEIQSIMSEFNKQYPSWNKNKYIKKCMPLFYRIYLVSLAHGNYLLIYYILSKLNKYLYL